MPGGLGPRILVDQHITIICNPGWIPCTIFWRNPPLFLCLASLVHKCFVIWGNFFVLHFGAYQHEITKEHLKFENILNW